MTIVSADAFLTTRPSTVAAFRAGFRYPGTSTRRTAFWLVCAVLFAAGTAALWIIDFDRWLPPQAEAYKPLLHDGLHLVAFAMAGAALLAVFNAVSLRPVPAIAPPVSPPLRAAPSQSFRFLLALLLATALLRSVNLSSSLWWDELVTVVRFVHRGILAILTFGGSANHVSATVLGWISSKLLGEGEWQFRLPLYLIGCVTPCVALLTLPRLLNYRVALWASVLMALHPTMIIMSSELRGYAGGVLCTYLAAVLFVAIIRTNTRRWTAAYVLCCTVGYGFHIFFILVPVSHAAAAAGMLIRRRVWRETPATEHWSGVLSAALWSIVLSLVVFGIQLPQALAYARSADGAAQHSLLCGKVLGNLLCYLSGTPSAIMGLALCVLSVFGWRRITHSTTVRIAFLAPVFAATVWLLVPGQRYSARLFFFVLPAFILGAASAFDRMTRSATRRNGLAGAAIAAAWLALAEPTFKEILLVGNPDLKDLARRLDGASVVLYGRQSDMNVYYFPTAAVVRRLPATSDEWKPLVSADYVIRGSGPREGWDARLLSEGFEGVEFLPSWRGFTCYQVYRRGAGTRVSPLP
ncbi:MAG: glycosyltransferase family 39 protein [Phycisphaerales bacterium]|nr:glycosyltransferase family 39 protein [Phycisphaerales bacterium]